MVAPISKKHAEKKQQDQSQVQGTLGLINDPVRSWEKKKQRGDTLAK